MCLLEDEEVKEEDVDDKDEALLDKESDEVSGCSTNSKVVGSMPRKEQNSSSQL
jgi:hypothetical protein